MSAVGLSPSKATFAAMSLLLPYVEYVSFHAGIIGIPLKATKCSVLQ